MSRNFVGRCFTCRGRGHRASDCPNNRVDDAESVDVSVHRKPHAFGGLGRAALNNEQHKQRADGFGENINSPLDLFTPQQLQQEPVLPQGLLGDSVAPVGQPHLAEARNATAAHLSAQELGMQNPVIMFPRSQTARELHAALAPRSVQQERERRRRHRQVDIMSIPVMNLSNPAGPTLPPQQRQAGRGALPSAHNMQDSRAGVGL